MKGDVMPRKVKMGAGQLYKYAWVARIYKESDGKVRLADVEYKIPGKNVFRVTMPPIHKLIMEGPVEEPNIEEEGDKDESKKPVLMEGN